MFTVFFYLTNPWRMWFLFGYNVTWVYYSFDSCFLEQNNWTSIKWDEKKVGKEFKNDEKTWTKINSFFCFCVASITLSAWDDFIPLSLSLTHTLSLSQTYTHTLFLYLKYTHKLFLSPSHTHTAFLTSWSLFWIIIFCLRRKIPSPILIRCWDAERRNKSFFRSFVTFIGVVVVVAMAFCTFWNKATIKAWSTNKYLQS